MQSDLFWTAVCKVSRLAGGALLQMASPKPVRQTSWVFLFGQGKAGVMRVPRLGTCSELRGGMRQRRAPANLVHHRDFCPALPALCTGSGFRLLGVLCQRGRRVCKLDFLPHLDSRDELCLPSHRVVSITSAQLWLGLAACHYFANQKADVTFIFLNERKTFKYK